VFMKSIIFWDMTPYSSLSVNRRFEGTCRLKQACHMPAFWFLSGLISWTLKMEAICSSETSVDTQRITWRHIPEDNILKIEI
jgi:hypothetical protein